MAKRTIVFLVATGMVALIHQTRGEGPRAGQTVEPEAVRVLSPSDLQASKELSPGDRGATYYFLEGLGTRATTRFADGVAVAERAADGRVVARVRDAAEREVAAATLSRASGDLAVLEYRGDGREGLSLAVRDRDARPTLDWIARQTYQLWKDIEPGTSGNLRWQDGFMRAAGARRRDDPLEVQTEWTDGVSAVATLKKARRPHVQTGQLIDGYALESRFLKNGAYSGGVVWFPEERTVTWSFPGLTQGYVDPERLKVIGGWDFTPDLAWTNVQAFAFDRFHRQIAEKGFVAGRQRGGLDRVLYFWFPVVQANEEGCDNLHWLDRTVYRPCCDIHDRCYEKTGCTSRSWWRWLTSWRCDYCNMGVLMCFSSGGSRNLPPLAY